MPTLHDEIRAFARSFSGDLSGALTLEKVDLLVEQQYAVARAVEDLYNVLFDAEVLRLKEQGCKNTQIAKKLLPEKYAKSHEKATQLIRDITDYYKKTKTPRLDEWSVKPEQLEDSLKAFVGSDVEKWTAVKRFLQSILSATKNWPETRQSSEMTKAQTKHLLHVLLRGSGGRPIDAGGGVELDHFVGESGPPMWLDYGSVRHCLRRANGMLD